MNSTAPARRWLREAVRDGVRDVGPRVWAMFVVMAFAGALVAFGVATGQQASSSPTESGPESERELATGSINESSAKASAQASTKASTKSSTNPTTASSTKSPGARDNSARAQSVIDSLLNPSATKSSSAPTSDASARDGADHGVRDLASTSTFNGRPIRIARTIRMKVTAYSPDAQSCGASADGITASGYSVFTNGGNLVAADPKVLPLGSIVSIPGYASDAVVPVLDVGGAIKGNKLDVLYPTHARARQWGVQELEVIVWEYADGQPSGFKRMRRPSK